MPLSSTFEARLIRARPLAPTVRELVFERIDGQPMVFEAGQWLKMTMPLAAAEGGEIRRSYSIASAPDGSPRFEIAVTRVEGGAGSMWLHGLSEGAQVTFLGPHGFFTRPPTGESPALMIATGTGVTPLRSMMRAALMAGSRTPISLILGVRHEQDILYETEMHAAAGAHDSIRFEPTLSQPAESWQGRRGYVQAHVRALWAELEQRGAGAPHAYVCGLQRMVGSVRELLRNEMGVDRLRVHSERYD